MSLGWTESSAEIIIMKSVQFMLRQTVMHETIASHISVVRCTYDPRHISGSQSRREFVLLSGISQRLENWIDVLDSRLPPLCNFILPSGGEAAARLHLARSVCRRAERSLVKLARDGDVDENTFKFMNRLSDFLFVAARTMTSAKGLEEKIWKKNNLE